MLNRIALGFFGLVLTFSAGEQLQGWWTKGEFWSRSRGGHARLLHYELEPVSYDLMLVTLTSGLVFGLGMVWAALGGKFSRKG